jgi:hypothetical protein
MQMGKIRISLFGRIRDRGSHSLAIMTMERIPLNERRTDFLALKNILNYVCD